MTDVHDRFRSLDQVPMPELWAEATHRATSSKENAGWDLPRMNRFAPIALGAGAIVLIVIAIGIGAFSRNPVVGPPSMPTPTPFPSATPVALPTSGSLGPGTYVWSNPANSWERSGNNVQGYDMSDPCTPGCADYVSISFTVPDGWATTDGLIYKHLGEPNEVAFSVWTPGRIHPDPCHWQESPAPAGSRAETWDRWGTILQNQAGREGSAPILVQFGGEETAGLTIERLEAFCARWSRYQDVRPGRVSKLERVRRT